MTTAKGPDPAVDKSPAPPPRVLEVRDLVKWYPLRSGLLGGRKRHVQAVNGISFDLAPGETLGLAGESGSGKTVTGEICSGLQTPTSGEVRFRGDIVNSADRRPPADFRRKVQMIFQDPYETLNPRWTVERTLQEPLLIHGEPSAVRRERVETVLGEVGLFPSHRYADKFPHQLSGGERQRVATARALVLRPQLVVADEPTSMLDVSLRSGLMLLFEELRKRYEFSMLFISHDMSVLRYLCDRVAIMYLGRIVEEGPVDRIVNAPLHPYTQALMQVVPRLAPGHTMAAEVGVKGEIPSPIDLPPGCTFAGRCPYRKDECTAVVPPLQVVEPGHRAACVLCQPALAPGARVAAGGG